MRLSMDFFCRDYFSSSSIHKVLYGSQYRRIFFWYYFVRRKDRGSFSPDSSTGPHITSSPPFSPTKEPLRSFHQQDVQPSLAHPATKPHLLGTNALRRASVDSHGSNALHCCAYPNCGTCPILTGAHATIFKSRIYIYYMYIYPFPCLQQALDHVLTV